MNKIFKISAIVILLVTAIYMIVNTFFMSNASTSTKFSGFGGVSSGSASLMSTDALEVPLDKVLINISSGQYRYMKADMSFKMFDDEDRDKLVENMPLIRDMILRFSSEQDGSKLVTDKGREQYKIDLKNLIYDTYKLDIEKIYFRNFVLAP